MAKKTKAKAKAKTAKKAAPRVQATAKSGEKRSDRITVISPGLVDWIKVRGGMEIRVYATYEQAISGGVDPGLAELAFKKADCSGSCSRGDNGTPNAPPTQVWCNDINCLGTGSCQCHLIRIYKDANGKWQEDDMGPHDKNDPVKKDGTSSYTCRCTT